MPKTRNITTRLKMSSSKMCKIFSASTLSVSYCRVILSQTYDNNAMKSVQGLSRQTVKGAGPPAAAAAFFAGVGAHTLAT
mmetsp:Transcript_80714/g.224228  ORF Transcript_80714/g.224228 Transcript_80714/m.224228 type:complete len:80 (+) Transcript_80714:593-832(+)